MGRTFVVSPVEAELDPLEPCSPRASLAARGFPDLEAISTTALPLVETMAAHPLLTAVHLAFAEHRPLALSPDDVWLCVAQAAGRHVHARAAELRDQLVAHEGRRELEVRRDEFVKGAPDNDWAGVVATFSDALREILGPRRHALFVASSSVTDAASRAASQIVLMGAVQQLFSYSVGTLCGIPSLTLRGAPQDWAAMARRVDDLEGLGLDWWLPALRDALGHFARAAAGDVDESVWRQLYKAEDASGGTYTSGWINALFPFLGDLGVEERDRNELALAPEVAHALEGNKLSAYSSGLVHAPFKWKFEHVDYDMSLIAGFVGVAQDARGVLHPQIGWAVGPEVVRRRFRQRVAASGLPVLWPRTPAEPDLLAHVAREAAGLGPFALNLWWVAELPSLAGLASVPALEELTVMECGQIESLAPLAGAASLRHVWLQQNRALTDIRALRELPALRVLNVAHNPALRDLSPIAELRGLEVLSLHGRELPEALRGVHKGERIAEIQALIRGCLG